MFISPFLFFDFDADEIAQPPTVVKGASEPLTTGERLLL
jgi:hypothetical protein